MIKIGSTVHKHISFTQATISIPSKLVQVLQVTLCNICDQLIVVVAFFDVMVK